MKSISKVLTGTLTCAMAGGRIGCTIALGIIVGPYKYLGGKDYSISSAIDDASVLWKCGVKDIKEGLKDK